MWVEPKTLRDNMTTSMIKFISEMIWCRYQCAHELISDNGSHLMDILVHNLTNLYVVVHKKSVPSSPRANGLAELMSKIS